MELSTPTTHGWLAVLLILPAYLATLAQTACAPYPVPIRLGNVSLSNGQTARGVELAIGVPEQTFAFIPQSAQNSTLLYGTNGVCTLRGSEKWSKNGCTSLRGGSYDLLASKTYKSTSHDAFPEDEGWPDIKPVTDTMKLNDNLTLDNLAMGIALSDWDTQGYFAMMGLGLGSNSTVLRVLKESGKIASRTWSFFWGRGFGMSSQLDGHLIFGGYDRAKVSGQRYTHPMTPGVAQCESQLVVNVTDLTMNFDNGTDVSIFGADSNPIPTCINITLPVMMRMPLYPYFENFLEYSDENIGNMGRSLGYHYWNMKYRSNQKPYDGSLTITLSSGLKVRVERDNLVLPHVFLDEQTGEMHSNASEKDLLIDSLQDILRYDMAQFGFQFLSAAYLQVNHDTSEFSLWAANPTRDEDIVALDSDDNDATDFCASQSSDGNENVNGGGDMGGGGNGTADGTADGDADDSTTGSASPGLSSGAIAGVAVGGAAVVALIVGAAVWYCKRRKSTKASSSTSPEMTYHTPWSPELEGQDLPPKKMSSPAYELGSGDTPMTRRYEMAG